jgi:hypothetical protein
VSELEKLIYDLIFSNENYHIIDISNYIDDLYQYKCFIKDLKKILKRSGVVILKNDVIINSKTVIWELNVKK